MSNEFESLVNQLTNTLLTQVGNTSPDVRHAVEMWAAKLDEAPNTASDLPEVVKSYVKKVSLYAYKVADADIQRLKDAGYSEDAIFEITLSAALGAGLKRLQRFSSRENY